MRKARSSVTMPLLCLALLGLVASGISFLFPPLLRFILVCFVFILLPGDIVLSSVFCLAVRSLLFRIPLSFVVGLSLLAVLYWAGSFFQISFELYHASVKLMVLGIFLFFLSKLLLSKKESAPNCHIFPSETNGTRAYIFAALLVGIFYYLTAVGVGTSGDSYDHIGYIRSIVGENTLDPSGVLAPYNGEGAPAVKSDPRKGAFHTIAAAISTSAGLDPVDLWAYIPVLWAPITFLSFVVFSCELLPGGAYVFFSSILFLIFQGGIGAQYLATAGYGQSQAMVYFWILFALSAELFRSNRRALLLLVALALTGGALVHIIVVVQFFVLLASFLVFHRYLRIEKRILFRLTFLTAILGLAVLVWKIITSYQSGNIVHMHPHGLLYITDRFFIVNPIGILKRYSLVFLGGVAMFPGLLWVKRQNRFARYSLAISILPLFLCMNPFVTPFLYSKGTYLVRRLILNVPSFQITALLLGSVVYWGRDGKKLFRKVAASLVLYIWVRALVIPSGGALLEGMSSIRVQPPRSSVVPEFPEIVDIVRNRLPRGSVILSDPVTSYAISAYTDAKVVSVLHQHGNPNDQLAMKRLRAVRDVLSPYVTQRESMEHLHDFGVDYVIINGSLGQPIHDFLTDWSPSFVQELRNKFGTLKENFKSVFDSDGVLVYRVLDFSIKKELWYPTVPYIQNYGRSLDNCIERIAWRGIRIKGVEIEPRKVVPGEKIKATVVYRKEDDLGYPLPLVLYIRFDNSKYLEAIGSYPGNKFVRRFEERRNGFFARFRVDHRILGGYYPPDMWPMGGNVREEITIKLPLALKEGEYDVRLKIGEDSLDPNHRLKDFFYNEDSFSGGICAKISVRQSLVR